MGCGQLQALAAAPPGKKVPVPTEYEAGWAEEPVWTFWKRQKIRLLLPGIEPLRKLVTTPTTLSQLAQISILSLPYICVCYKM